MPQQFELFGGTTTEPTIAVDPRVYDLIPNFEPNVQAYSELLATNGVPRDRVPSAHLTFQPYNSVLFDSFIRGVLRGAEVTTSHITLNRYFGSTLQDNSAEVYVASQYRRELPVGELQADIKHVGNTALHEVGHQVDNTVRGRQAPDARIRAANRIAEAGLIIKYAALGTNDNGFMTYSGLWMLGHRAGRAVQKLGDNLYQRAYASSPAEARANRFADENAAIQLFSGEAVTVDADDFLGACFDDWLQTQEQSPT